MKPAILITVLFLVIVSLLHLMRLIFGIEVIVDNSIVPMWISVFAFVGSGLLAVWLWLEQRK